MKYEIIKGSEKDFEGAPEWATECVWNDKGSESFCYWLNPKTKTIFNPNWHIKPDCWNEEYGWRNYIKAERRPITEPIWDGETLPPLGVACEVNDERSDSWTLVDSVLAHANIHGISVAVFQIGGYIAYSPADRFRPIRSPEDVARNEAKGIIAELCRSSASNGHSADLIYDAISAGKIKGVVMESKVADLKINITTDEMWREFEKKSDMEDVYKLVKERAYRRGSF